MVERLKLFMDSYNLSASDLADKIKVQRSSISHLLSGRNNPSLTFVMKLLETYPELSPDWLLFDKGAMIRTESSSHEKVKSVSIQNDLFSNLYENDKSDLRSTNTKMIENEKETEKEIVSNPSMVHSKEKILDESTRDVEKIVVLFKDRTFIEYKSR